MVDFNQQCHLLFDHPELLVHRLEVVSEEAGPVKQLLEVPQGDLPDGARQAAMSEIEGNPKMGAESHYVFIYVCFLMVPFISGQ